MPLGVILVILIVLLFSLLLGGFYVGLSLASVGVFGLEVFGNMGKAVGATLFNSINAYVLAAIPFFIFMGNIVLKTGLSQRLYQGVSQWTRVIPGGLTHYNIVSSAIFAAVSGSSVATAATIGTVAYPEQTKRGYDASLVTGSLAAGGTLGILIPPSVNMIVYGAFVGASVGRLFAGGIIPGILLALLFMGFIASRAVLNKSLGPSPERINRRYFIEALIAFKDIWPMLLIIFVIMGGIYGGVMTATESAAISTVLALVLGFLVGKVNYTIVKDAALSALRTTAMILLIVVGAHLLGNAMSMLRIPATLARMVEAAGLGPLAVWGVVIALYLILGCVMDTLAMILVTLPITYPLIVTFAGFNPIWFGVQLVILCEVGLLTPPVGMNLFVIQGIAKGIKFETIIKGSMPFFLILLAGIALFTFVPDIILILPNYMLGD